MPTQDAINNSWQIREELTVRSKAYHAPSDSKRVRLSKGGRSGKVKVWTQDEILVYKLMQVKEVESLQ